MSGDKPVSERTAVAEGAVRMSREAFEQVAAQAVAKGDVLAVAEVAGTMGCQAHGRADSVCATRSVSIWSRSKLSWSRSCRECGSRPLAKATGQTGVEMEALTAVAVACLTVYDMVKASRSGNDYRGGTAGEQDRVEPGEIGAEPRS